MAIRLSAVLAEGHRRALGSFLLATALAACSISGSENGVAAQDTVATGSVRSVEVGGGSITVVEREASGPGAGPSVLFLHGAAYTSQTWVANGILDAVAGAGHRAVAIDLPGSGSSGQVDLANDEFLVALFTELGLDPASTVIVSPSMSGTFSLPALRHPFFSDLAGYVPVAPVGASSFAAQGPVVDIPALVVWGDGDGADPQGAAEQLAAGFADAEVLVLADAGHAAYESQPAAFTDAFLAFVDAQTS